MGGHASSSSSRCGSQDGSQVASLGGSHLYPLSYLDGPRMVLFDWWTLSNVLPEHSREETPELGLRGKSDLVVCACNFSPWEVEVRDQEFKANPGYLKSWRPAGYNVI